MGTVYLIHFSKKFYHAQHYIGYTDLPVEDRLKRHEANDGARILKAVRLAGIDYEVVKIWEGVDRAFERRLKNQKNASRLCPVCRELKKGAKVDGFK